MVFDYKLASYVGPCHNTMRKKFILRLMRQVAPVSLKEWWHIKKHP